MAILDQSTYLQEVSSPKNGINLEAKSFTTKDANFKIKYKKILNKFKKKNYGEALALIDRNQKKYPKSPELWSLKALILQNEGKKKEALNAFEIVNELEPGRPANLTNLGLALEKIGKIDAAIIEYNKAIAVDKNYAVAHYNLGCLYLEKLDLVNATEKFKSALEIKSDFPEALIGLGKALDLVGKKDEGLKCFELALNYSPNSFEGRLNLGLISKSNGNFEKAELVFRALCKEFPNKANIKLFLAEVLNKTGQEIEALSLIISLLKTDENNISFLYEAALSCRGLKRYDDAFDYLKKLKVVEPNNAAAENLFAIIEQETGNEESSAKRFKKAIELAEEAAPIFNNLGLSFFEQNKLDLAVENYTIALQKSGTDFNGNKTRDLAISGLYYSAIKMCDWAKAAVIEKKFSEIGIKRETPTPFVLLRFEDNPEKQLKRAVNYKKSVRKINGFSRGDFTKKSDTNSKIKVGYFGADFHDHATMWLMAGLLRNHNKNQFEIFIFSYGKTKEGVSRILAKKYADDFYDVEGKKDEAILKLTRELGLDIAIDLKGFTRESRSELFSNYLAPIQINYLGYPSTMGVNHIDYIVADNVIIPEENRKYYSEQIIYLPDTYQPNDNERVIENTGLTRNHLGVGPDDLLLCSLNQSYKITRAEYNIWMRILLEVKDSKLMLLASNKWANKNLLIEAEKRGVDASRIIFVSQLSHGKHLERLALADLFLDTFNVNAHTTASDALWAGLPVVTKVGQQFAARVAASLLCAVGMPELIAQTDEEYEALIMKLSTDRNQLKQVKKKLQENRLTTPLFDTQNYTKNFENALIEVYEKSS